MALYSQLNQSVIKKKMPAFRLCVRVSGCERVWGVRDREGRGRWRRREEKKKPDNNDLDYLVFPKDQMASAGTAGGLLKCERAAPVSCCTTSARLHLLSLSLGLDSAPTHMHLSTRRLFVVCHLHCDGFDLHSEHETGRRSWGLMQCAIGATTCKTRVEVSRP